MDAKLIGTILTISFVATLVIGFLIGLWRGWKKSLTNLAFSLLGIVVAIFITPVIVNALLSITIDYNGTAIPLREIVLIIAKENPDLALMLNGNANLEMFLLGLPNALVSAVAFILVTLVVEFIMYIIYKIVSLIFIKKKNNKKKIRVLGGAIGAVKAFIITAVAFMPFASLIGLVASAGQEVVNPSSATMTADAEEVGNESSEEASSPLNMVFEIAQAIDSSWLAQASGMFGMDDALLDYYAKVEVDGKQVVIREEIQNVLEIVEIGKDISSLLNNGSEVSALDYSSIKVVLNKLSESALFEKVVYQTIGDVITNYQQYSFTQSLAENEEVKEILDPIVVDIKSAIADGKTYGEYFTGNISTLIDAVEVIGESGMIDEIASLENKEVNNILKTITSQDNIDDLKLGLKTIFSADIVRAIIQPVTQKGIAMTGLNVDEIEVDTNAWTEEDWNNTADSIVNVIEKYSNITDEIDSANDGSQTKKGLVDIIADPTILVSEGNYNISSITHNLGQMIDDFRSIKLLQNSRQGSIIDSLLEDNNIILPAEDEIIYNNDGTVATIENYTQYFDFMSPALEKIKSSGIYTQIKNQTSSKQTIKYIANQVSIEGNENLLQEIILPLYQVEPTKSLIVDSLTSGIGELIDTTALTEYSLWKADLKYISSVLKGLNTQITGSAYTYLDLVLENQMTTFVDALSPTDVDEIFKPVLYGKSTSGVEETLMSELSSALKEITKGEAGIASTEAAFVDGDEDDQATEFCNIVKKFLIINKLGSTFEEINDALAENVILSDDLLGGLLNDLRDNAYRNKINTQLNCGVFQTVFVDLINQMKVEYATEVEVLEANPTVLEEALGVSSLAEENYSEIDYTKLVELLSQYKQATTN